MTEDAVAHDKLRQGQAVRRARLRRGVTLRDLARRLGVSPATVSGLENGRSAITLLRLTQISAALDVPLRALIDTPGTGGDAPAELPGDRQPESASRRSWRHFEPLVVDRVLGGAVRAFVSTGYHGANMRSIASKAGISVPGLYHHYASKQALLARILDITMRDLAWRLEQARHESDDPRQRLELVVEALALFHARRGDFAFIGASEMRSLEPANYDRIAHRRGDVQDLLDELITDAVPHTVLPPSVARNAGKAIASMCTGLAQWFHVAGTTSPEVIAREYAAFAMRLVGLQPSYATGS